ncbi:hypothetical protein Vretifemale_4153 [Volvox reticuliferus]|nr:hypothetical protein Vretifemale_4153 [Volvox reticuliferus]
MPGWDVSTRNDGVVAIWWHHALLQQFDLWAFFTRQISADRFCASMVENWGYNGFKESIVTTTCLRKRLSKALFLYRYLKSMEDDYAEGLPGWPKGALNSCPCCGDTDTCTSRARGLVGAGDVDAAAAGVVNVAMGPAGVATSGASVMKSDAVEADAAMGLADAATVEVADPMAAEVHRVDGQPGDLDWAQDLWTSSVETAGPGPASVHSVHFDANF